MRRFRVYQVDSFTTEKFRGNPAGVVPEADGLSEREMLAIARELGNSETAFVFSPDGADHDVQIRFFTPAVEVPVCGHATVAAHYVRAVERQLASTTVRQKTKIGVLPVEILKSDRDYSIMMTQGKIEFQAPLAEPEQAALLNALGLSPADVEARCPIQIVSTGHSKVMIGLRSHATLDALTPDLAALRQLSSVIGCNGYFAFTLDAPAPGVLTHGRMFAPAIGIAEDPVTGNANGPLGAYLVRHRLAPHDGRLLRFVGEQGAAIGRSGTVEVEVTIRDAEPAQVRIGGSATVVFQTEITLP